ncbi:helix-turn-helix domain-containing protein [Secundilactobacillus folii]|uniref:XRE family transcriptional regulator n=1 Tax=Secundilactobacillus folii TaxID=2678357 RepID=A0A7X2XXA9_9LACO|nr:helix-turn-helix transcriptional regulator [Secundilactobacillus folii]MTV82825.1 XRE family transcriptional regulator [Secundilactobacillus folii]
MDINCFVKRRKALKLSQCKLSSGICTQATLSKFESNGHVPSLSILNRLCARMGMTVDDLYQNQCEIVDSISTRLDRIEKHLMTENYQQALRDLGTIGEDQIESLPAKSQFYYLRGLINTLINGKSADINFDFSLIFNELDASQKTIFTYLAFLGSGIMYHRQGEIKRAAFYFDKVNHYLSECEKQIDQMHDGQYYLRVLMMIYYIAEFNASQGDFRASNRLIDKGVAMCSEQHVTYYLPRLKFLATQNAITLRRPTEEVQSLMSETLAFAKINQNQVIEVKLAALKRRLEQPRHTQVKVQMKRQLRSEY